ncbi:zinc finger protein 33B [Agrilus planipennis]|uniref:Zinc finger protein 33B n=1 Tax=Agrilus planipennis TaxID=224129 RepID=A0A1W4X6R4_AGRPL|nr:zinc finger protein 33B [Agrilus planipennis]
MVTTDSVRSKFVSETNREYRKEVCRVLDQKTLPNFHYCRNKWLPPNPRIRCKQMDDKSHSYDCRCQDCHSKHGDLPLLVQVIEQREYENEQRTRAKEAIEKTKLYVKQEQQNCHQSTSFEHGTIIASKSVIKKTETFTEDVMPSTSSGIIKTQRSPSFKTKKEMKCSYCSKNFSHRGDLNKHVRTHTGDTPYQCETCWKDFRHKSNLTRHSKLHSGLKPYQCPNCNKEFSRKDKLSLHRNSCK